MSINNYGKRYDTNYYSDYYSQNMYGAKEDTSTVAIIDDNYDD